MKEQNIKEIFPEEWREFFDSVARRQESLQEIRLRAEKPISVVINGREYFLDSCGEITEKYNCVKILKINDLTRILNHISKYSLYAYEDELRQGFLTVPGGHRVGIVGQAVLDDREEIKTMKYINAMNIRIAHEIKGAADSVMPFLYCGDILQNTLIISPPACGKTTLLRDIIRQVSDGNVYGKGKTVGLVDERSEIAGGYRGIPQNDVGIRTDILDSCPKVKGMMMLIRSMAPKVLAIDEVGKEQEWETLRYASYCGISLLATMHGERLKDYQKCCGQDIFKLCIVLRRHHKKCVVEQIFVNEGEWKCRFQR